MPAKKSFPLRVNEEVLDSLKRWSSDELRSVNAQIEYLLRDALRKAGRLPAPAITQLQPGEHQEGPASTKE